MNVQLSSAAAAPSASTVKETQRLVELSIKKLRASFVTLEGNSSQIQTMRAQQSAELEVLEAVLQSLKGKHTELGTYTH